MSILKNLCVTFCKHSCITEVCASVYSESWQLLSCFVKVSLMYMCLLISENCLTCLNCLTQIQLDTHMYQTCVFQKLLTCNFHSVIEQSNFLAILVCACVQFYSSSLVSCTLICWLHYEYKCQGSCVKKHLSKVLLYLKVDSCDMQQLKWQDF